MSDTIRFYWRLFLRRSPWMFGLVVLSFVVAVIYALNQPSRYEATARLLVEAPQIPDELASTTVNTETSEQLQIIQERLLRRANLIDIANDFGVLRDAPEPLSPDRVSEAMREATNISIRGQRGQANFIDISFTASNPDIAAAVVNEYVTRILTDNVQLRNERAGNTLEFFEQQVDSLSGELAIQSGRISEFKAKNSDTLPESLNFRLSRQTALDERLQSLRRELDSLAQQRERVTSVYEETGTLRTPEANLTPEERQLRDLESELASALAVYSETNPRVTVLRTRIEQLQRVVSGQSANGETGNPTSSIYEITLAEIDARAQSLVAQIGDVEQELENLRALIQRTPQTAIELETLERDYNNIQQQYDAAVERLARARTGEQIELTAQGQRITVVENALPPEWPTSPNRKLIAAAGGLAGVAVAAGLFALLEVLNGTIRRPAELVSRIGITPLATIPYIETRRQRMSRRLVQFLSVLGFFVILPAAIYYVHTQYLPLGDLFDWAKDVIRGTATWPPR